VKLYLPRSIREEQAPEVAEEHDESGGSETLLVVEDEPAVLVAAVDMLSDLGYRVLTAPDASTALAIIEAGARIDLLFTDVVMPGSLSSPELAARARARLPSISVLYTSGYPQNAIVHSGRLDAGVELLPKPYSRSELARKLRAVLAAQAR
jgi:CheY-like chemotaxis protein